MTDNPKKLPLSDYEQTTAETPEDERASYDRITYTMTITLTCSGVYSDAESLSEEIADSLSWLDTSGHHAILGGTWTATPEVTHWTDE